jgi:hypothetical protein
LYNLACLQLDNENTDAAAHFMRETLVIYEVAFGPSHQLTQDVERQLAILEAGLADRAYEQQQQQQAGFGGVDDAGREERVDAEGEGDDAGHGSEPDGGSSVVSEAEDFDDDLAAAAAFAYPTKPGDETTGLATLGRGHYLPHQPPA